MVDSITFDEALRALLDARAAYEDAPRDPELLADLIDARLNLEDAQSTAQVAEPRPAPRPPQGPVLPREMTDDRVMGIWQTQAPN